MHGLGASMSTCSRSISTPRSWRTFSTRARGSTSSKTSRCATSSLELTSPDHGRGHPRLRRRGQAPRDGPARRGRCSGSPTRSPKRFDARELVELYEQHRAPARAACSPRWSRPGVRIDVGFLEELRQGARRRVPTARGARSTRTRASSSTSTPTPQLRRILFEKLGLTPVKKTKTGPSTDADSLQKLARGAPDRRGRCCATARSRSSGSTYADALPPLVHADGRIHATFNQLATTTGRISSEIAEPAERPGAHLGRPRVAQGVHRRRGLRAAHRRLLADRAAGARAPGRGPGPHRRRSSAAPTSTPPPRRPCSTSTRRRSTTFQRRFAKVVNYGLAYGMEAYGLGTAARHPDRPGPRDPRRVLRRVPQRRRRT